MSRLRRYAANNFSMVFAFIRNDIRLDNPAYFFCRNAVHAGLIFFCARDGTGRQMRRHKQNCPCIYLHYHLRKGSNPFFTFTGNGCDGYRKTPEVDYRLSNMNADDDKCEDHHTTLFAVVFCLIVKANIPLQAGDTYRSNPCRTGPQGNTCRALWPDDCWPCP